MLILRHMSFFWLMLFIFLQICVTGFGDVQYWQPLGSTPNCAEVDTTGICVRCIEGLEMIKMTCTEPADVLHMTFDGNFNDMSGHERDGFLVNGPNAYEFVDVC